MATGKRASMREGPLADLFRRTTEDNPPRQGQDEPAASAPAPEAPAPAPEGQAPTPQATAPAMESIQPPVPAAEAAPAKPGQPENFQERQARREREVQQAEQVTPQRATPEPRRRAHPSLEADVGPMIDEPEREIPTPQERLRQAFSADIPQNFMERSEPPASERDVYARPEHDYDAYPASAAAGGPVLRVVGVGGAGVNAVNRMVEADISGVEFLAINTDLQSLQLSAAHETLHIGDTVTRGLGSGSDPDLGRRAAREEYDRIKAMLRGSDMVFIAAGAGGGTGTGAAPIVAMIARELGALTVGIVTLPFQFEGSRRRAQAEAGIAALREEVDTLIVVPNNRLLSVLDRGVSMVDAFRVADDVLRQGVQGISDLVTLPGLINLDFADVRTIMTEAGSALLGIGMGTGERRAIDAAEQAVASPLLETSMEGARSILLSITGGTDISLWEVNEAAKAVAEAAHPEANIIFGAMVDEKLEDQVWVTVVATHFGDERPRRREPAPDARSRPEPESRALREPMGEPRVSRMRRSATELDVPEFIPRR